MRCPSWWQLSRRAPRASDTRWRASRVFAAAWQWGSGRDSDVHLVMTWVWWVNHDLTMKHDIFVGFHHCLWWFYKDLTVSGSNSWDLFESTSGQKPTEDPQLSHVYMGLTPSTSGFSPNCGRLMLQLFRYHLVSPLDHVHQWMKVPFLKRPQQTILTAQTIITHFVYWFCKDPYRLIICYSLLWFSWPI
jgi:hypothetical protein